MRSPLLVALLGLCLLWSGCGANKPDKKEDAAAAVEMAAAAVRPMEVTVRAQGTLATAESSSAQVAPVITARLLAVTVREGDDVAVGQLLATLDNRADREQVKSALAALAAAQADRDNTVQQARATLTTEDQTLHKLRVGARPQEMAQADLAVRRDRATRDRADTEYRRVQFLYAKGTAARRQLDDARTALQVANATLKSTQEQANLVRAGTRREDLLVQEAKAQAAQQTVGETVRLGDAKVRQADAALAAARTVARQGDLFAPISGRIVRRMLNPGDVAGPSTPVVQIANTSHLVLVADLPAQVGSPLRRGMAARVHVTTVSATIPGRLTAAGQVDPQSGLMEVRIALHRTMQSLKVGDYATADIVLRSLPNAVVVPKAAIVLRDGKTAVMVVDASNKAHEKPVTVLTEADGLVAVRGINGGDRVIHMGQYELEDGAQVRDAGQPREESASPPARARETAPP